MRFGLLVLVSLMALATSAFCQGTSVRLLETTSGGDALAPSGNEAFSFVLGFNQAWLRNAYGSQWTRNFDEAEARRMVQATAALGGTVLRMWLFEGLELEGVVWDGDPSKSAWGFAGTRTRPTSLAADKIRNVERFLTLAEENGITVYLTLFDANLYSQNNPAKDRRRNEWWNVLNDEYGAGEGFRRTVLAPLLAVCATHRRAVFAVDLMNELNALVRHHWFANGWDGARRFVRTWREFIRAFAGLQDLPVSASFGHHDAVAALVARRLPPDSVDFYDFHAYDDDGSLPTTTLRAAVAGLGRPIFLGEFGQRSKAFDDALQVTVTERFIANARACGLAGALAWRLSDIRPGYNAEARLSYEAYGRWRPAAEAFRRAATNSALPTVTTR